MVTDNASLTWLHNFKEPEGVVARWITRLQPFDFDIMHRPGKHHSHNDGLSRRTSRPCKRNTCPECGTLLDKVAPEEDLVRALTPCQQYMEDFDGYIELVEDDSTLFRDPTAPVPSTTAQAIPPDLLWYMGRHPAKEGAISSDGSPTDNSEGTAISRAKVIEQLLDTDSHQAETQTEPGDFYVPDKGDSSDLESSPSHSELELAFLSDTTEETELCQRVRATDRSKKARLALHDLIDLSNVDIAHEQDADPNIGLIKKILLNSPERPTWDSVRRRVLRLKPHGLSTTT